MAYGLDLTHCSHFALKHSSLGGLGTQDTEIMPQRKSLHLKKRETATGTASKRFHKFQFPKQTETHYVL